MTSFQSQLEAQKGVSGFHDTQEELEKVSSVKSDLDEQKGKSLDEISDMVRIIHVLRILPLYFTCIHVFFSRGWLMN